MTQELDRIQYIHGRQEEIFQEGQFRNFIYPFQIADVAMQMDIHKTLYLFYHISLCWFKLNSQSFF